MGASSMCKVVSSILALFTYMPLSILELSRQKSAMFLGLEKTKVIEQISFLVFESLNCWSPRYGNCITIIDSSSTLAIKQFETIIKGSYGTINDFSSALCGK